MLPKFNQGRRRPSSLAQICCSSTTDLEGGREASLHVLTTLHFQEDLDNDVWTDRKRRMRTKKNAK